MKNNLNIQETVYQFCKLYNPQLQKDKIRILLESSLFYPSVLSVYRALLSCKIDCNVVKTDIHGLLSLHQTMLLHTKEKEDDKLVLVKSLKDEQAVYYDSFKQQYHVCLLPKEYSLKDLLFMLHDKEIWEHQQK